MTNENSSDFSLGKTNFFLPVGPDERTQYQGLENETEKTENFQK
jgi:hypothetical protein